jgi:molybdenum ABC transporter molybdate-binding protein
LVAIVALVVLLAKPSATPTAQGQPRTELVLYCAAGLAKPVQEVVADYERQYGSKVLLQFDASGPLLSTIRTAPDRGDLYLAGEEAYVREARSLGLVREILPVARQHLVIAVKPGNPKKIAAVADLLPSAVKVAIPSPERAAVGKIAKRALSADGQWEALEAQIRQSAAKISVVATVTEAAQAVKVGTVDAAVVWDATARQFDLEPVEVPVFREQTVEPAAIGVLAGSRQPTAALHFARYLTARDRGEPVFNKHHLEPLDDADLWVERPTLKFMSGAMLKPAVDDLLKDFQAREGVEITTIYAGCGIHVAQMKAMQQKAEATTQFPDAYFACDVSFMSQVQQWFEASRTISRNDMVLAVAKGNPKGVKSASDLARPELRVGLAHPQNSALGALTDDLLKKLGLHEKVYGAKRSQPIVHTDAGHMLVNQLRAGALDLTVVYRSNILSAGETTNYVEIVEMNLPEAVAIQPYAVAKGSNHKYLMRRLLEAILTPASKAHFVKSGFQWVAKDPAP